MYKFVHVCVLKMLSGSYTGSHDHSMWVCVGVHVCLYTATLYGMATTDLSLSWSSIGENLDTVNQQVDHEEYTKE